MNEKRYPLRKKILLALATFCLAVLICEIVLWVIDYHYAPLQIEVEGTETDWRFTHSFGDDHFVYDPKLIWRPRKNHAVFNSQGFRGKELPDEKGPGEFRIFTVGDSNTLGWAEGGASWPMYLEELVTTRYADSCVINAGVWGYSSFQGLQRFEETLPYDPDMVLISFGANDAHRVIRSDAEFAVSDYQSPLFETRTGQLVMAAWHRILSGGRTYTREDLVPRVSLQEYRENLTEMIEISRQRGIQCVLLTRPYLDVPFHLPCWRDWAPDYRAATIELGRHHGVPVIDVYSYFGGKEEFFADESHFTVEGHMLAAEFIFDEIGSLLPHTIGLETLPKLETLLP
ncbi:MAG TPA: SGNH/GDSL hydrolase family protein [Thermoguttaceae bacterium]|nr:SGNH/GDSL hydrolase family protein [Thermoguttaceae bacterium]